MSHPELLLDRLFFPSTQVIAYQDPPETEMGAPNHLAHVYFLEGNKVLVNLGITWGEESTTPYFVQVHAHAVFMIEAFELSSREEVNSITRSIVSAVDSASREHIAQTTARGPHGTVLLPMTQLQPKDVQLQLHTELAATLGIQATQTEPAADAT